MPANLSPEYKKAEQAFREASEDRERLLRLRDMLRTIPKHKGTEHLQADIKSRIKQLTEELAGPKKGAARTGPVHTLRPEGAAQVALLGPPNAGKSSLHVKLTGSRADVGPYPFTTHEPMPACSRTGMCPFNWWTCRRFPRTTWRAGSSTRCNQRMRRCWWRTFPPRSASTNWSPFSLAWTTTDLPD